MVTHEREPNTRTQDDILGTSGSTVEEALANLSLCGFQGLLTSGGPGRAIENIATVAHIIRAARASGQSLREIIVGGGVRSSNMRELAETLPRGQSSQAAAAGLSVWFHSSCLTEPSVSDEVDGEELRRIAECVTVVASA